MSPGALPGPLDHPAVWNADELPGRPEWNHALSGAERDELLTLAGHIEELDGTALVNGVSWELAGAEALPLPALGARLARIRDQLEDGTGIVRLRGFPVDEVSEARARALYWALAIRLGTPVSQSATGEKIFSVRDAGHADDDPRSRGPNTRRRLSFHTDRSDVVGFLCLRQAARGGDNEVASSMAVYNALRENRTDLLALLMEPYPYKRHTVDPGNPRAFCRQPVFSFQGDHFACCFLRVLIDRAHGDPALPDLTAAQIEALDLVETAAAEPGRHLRFRHEAGDILFINNWVILHRRTAFVDHPEEHKRRHILRLWLSMPNSRPLHPLFADNFGATAAGAIRGGMTAFRSGA